MASEQKMCNSHVLCNLSCFFALWRSGFLNRFTSRYCYSITWSQEGTRVSDFDLFFILKLLRSLQTNKKNMLGYARLWDVGAYINLYIFMYPRLLVTKEGRPFTDIRNNNPSKHDSRKEPYNGPEITCLNSWVCILRLWGYAHGLWLVFVPTL